MKIPEVFENEYIEGEKFVVLPLFCKLNVEWVTYYSDSKEKAVLEIVG